MWVLLPNINEMGKTLYVSALLEHGMKFSLDYLHQYY